MYYSIENVKTEQVVVTRSLTFESNQRAPQGTSDIHVYVCIYTPNKDIFVCMTLSSLKVLEDNVIKDVPMHE